MLSFMRISSPPNSLTQALESKSDVAFIQSKLCFRSRRQGMRPSGNRPSFPQSRPGPQPAWEGRCPQPESNRFDRAAAQELFHPAPSPRVAANGVEWLAVSGWEKIPWLWHGFSTRRGGASRAYCPEDAPGRTESGLYRGDSGRTVARNRRLLAEAVTGDAATPLVAIRQFHSNSGARCDCEPTRPRTPLEGATAS